MADSPVVLIHGARQCGKSTLARQYGEARGYHSLTFDDSSILELAQADPNVFVADLPDRVILDEVQRVPEIFLALKLTVDRNRAHGRFLLTGSSNILLLPSLADSLAGRMAIVRLHPFAQCELVKSRPTFLEKLLSAHFPISKSDRQGRSLADRIVQGGFPTMISLPTPARRARWHRDYVETIVQRDIRSLARIASVDSVPRLLELLSGQTARALNISERPQGRGTIPAQRSSNRSRITRARLSQGGGSFTSDPWAEEAASEGPRASSRTCSQSKGVSQLFQ